MCVVSMISDHYIEKWQEKLHPPVTVPYYARPFDPAPPLDPPTITPEEVEEFRRLLERARKYDKRTGQPDCELEEKRKTLKDLARQLGVAIEFV